MNTEISSMNNVIKHRFSGCDKEFEPCIAILAINYRGVQNFISGSKNFKSCQFGIFPTKICTVNYQSALNFVNIDNS